MKFERRDFIKISSLSAAVSVPGLESMQPQSSPRSKDRRDFNAAYTGAHLQRVAFPLGGMGAGMMCLEGTGAISHLSLRNQPDVFKEPLTFSALSIAGVPGSARVLEGPVPTWKLFGPRLTGNGSPGTSFGLPRFRKASFQVRFPFARIDLQDPDVPVQVRLTAWSPFVPGDADASSLPFAAFEYRFRNTGRSPLMATFSFHSQNFMVSKENGPGDKGDRIKTIENGFLLWQRPTEEEPEAEGGFAAFLLNTTPEVDACWFRGGWFDPLTIVWKQIEENRLEPQSPVDSSAPGASLFLPLSLSPGEEQTVVLAFCWYVPRTTQRLGKDVKGAHPPEECESGCCPDRKYYIPWYAGRFRSIEEAAGFWRQEYADLKHRSTLFSDCLYDTTLPDEVTEAVAANLTILKSPTLLRQCDGRIWGWEGCSDSSGCCYGTCTHVWNYAQAIPHLFPELERGLRLTEFEVSQNEAGHQNFRTSLPIRPARHDFHAAADGQLGGIMKVHREWRISGDTGWVGRLWPRIVESLEYCIKAWDPRERGVLEEPHHNTYDIEFWGPEGMCTSFYLGALAAAIRMGSALGQDTGRYRKLLERGRRYMEEELFNGEYFFQKVRWRDLSAPNPVELAQNQPNVNYSPEAMELLEKEGPKYQYGNGCLSDGVLGFWLARMCGLGEIIDGNKVKSHLRAVHRHNLKKTLEEHANPQRPSFAAGSDGGLLLCTWPHHDAPSLPFVYSNEVWTGIEYQVASHLMLEGEFEPGLEIVRTCRRRYDGSVRNPFDEYECGHWYARALASYGLLQGMTGLRYDALDKSLIIDAPGKDFRCFLAVDGGFGSAGLRQGRPFLTVVEGKIEVRQAVVGGQVMELQS